MNSKKLSPLPADYANIKKLFTLPGNPDKRLWIPLCSIKFEDMLSFSNFDITFDEELAWLCNVQQSFSTYDEDTEYSRRASYCSQFNRGTKQLPGINTIRPLISEKMNMLQTQGHCMTLNINLTKTLDPTQTLIDVNDQPVYALTKELQYHCSHLFGKYCPIKGTCISSNDQFFVSMVN